MDKEPVRKSIAQRLAEMKQPEYGMAQVITAEEYDLSTTSSFRIEATGELSPVAAAPVASSTHSSQQLGQLPSNLEKSHHLLLLPSEHTGDEIEALAISVWDEAGWTSPGTLHLTESATLEGPWTLPGEDRSVWMLQCIAARAGAPTEAIKTIDPWARAFPEGMPVGTEYKTLVVLHRIARRLDGELRLAGSDTVMRPDRESAVNLRVYSPNYLPADELGVALQEVFPGIEAAATAPALGEAVNATPPYAFLLPVGLRSKVIIGIRQVDQTPRVLRWESWANRSAFLYELNWVNPHEILGEAAISLGEGNISRVARTERGRVIVAIEQIARVLTGLLPQMSIVDEDNFLLHVDDLAQLPETPGA